MTIGLLRITLAATLIGGCTFYHPLALDDSAHMAASLADLKADPSRIRIGSLASHKFDPSDGLDITEVATLAVINNPDLRLARDDARIVRAQSFAAGLLPDPQVSLTRDFPRRGIQGTTSAYNAGLGYDLSSIIAHAVGAAAAREENARADLNLLWQEWQVVAQARLLCSRALSQDRLLVWMKRNHELLQARLRHSQEAEAAGNLGIDQSSAVIVAAQDAARQQSDLERQQLQVRQDLNTLLGLAPGVLLELVDEDLPGVPDEEAARRYEEQLPARRPDLLALKAGFAAQDARYRQAILAQFPPLNLTFTRARDTAGVSTVGFALATALPLWNRNRGNIRIEDASRERLRDEYESRLAAARAEVERVLQDNRLVSAQLRAAEDSLPALDRAADNARRALDEGTMEAASFAAVETARISKHVEAVNLAQSLREGEIALLTLVGGDFPAYSASRNKP